MKADHHRRRTDAPGRRRTRKPLLSERSLKNVLGSTMWISTTAVIVGASFVPQVAPENVNFWRLVLGVPALAMGVFTATVGPRLSDRMFQLMVELNMIPALAVNAVLLQITPATEAVLFNMVVTLIFAGYFLRLPALAMTLAGGIGIALSTLFTEPASQTPYLGSFLVVYISTISLAMALMHLQNSETLDALAKVRRRALTDPLTGLANLRALERAAESRFASHAFSRYKPETPGLLLLDLDNFKSANTKHGHVGGDYALRMIAKQLMRVADDDTVVARVGGDEFAILTTGSSRAQIEQAGEIFRSAVRAAGAVMEMPGVEIDAAVGVAVYPDDGLDLSQLLDVADRSMYERKGAKRHTVPNLEKVVVQGDTRPPWLEELEESDEPERDGTEGSRRDLDWATGGRIPLLASRTLYARSSAIAWGLASLILGASLLVPNAYPDPALKWWMATFGGLALVPVILIVNATPRTRTHMFNDVISLLGLAAVIALTGGLDSTAPALLILLVASQAWFWRTRAVTFRLIGPVLVAASPIFYDNVSDSQTDVIALVTIYTLVALIVTFVAAMYFNRYFLTKLQRDGERLALTDPLTGVSNRRAFNSYVQNLLDSDREEEFAIVMIDLDNFKQVNTTRGHRAGDRVLRAIADALKTVARDEDCVARVGGDEFAAVLSGVGVDGARSLAERFVGAVAETQEARESGVGASAGFALWPLHGDTLDQLVFTADTALMAVKASGKGSARVARIVTAVQ